MAALSYRSATAIRSAIKLRHGSDDRVPDKVLSECLDCLTVLIRQDKITGNEAQELRNKINHARQMDKAGTQ